MSGGGRIASATFLNLASHLGADRVITKPFRLATLVAIVDDLMAGPIAINA